MVYSFFEVSIPWHRTSVDVVQNYCHVVLQGEVDEPLRLNGTVYMTSFPDSWSQYMTLFPDSWSQYMTSFPDPWSQYMTSFPDPWSQYIPYQESGNETQLYTASRRCMEQFPCNPVKGRPTKAMPLCTQLYSYSNPVALISYQLASGTSHKGDTLLNICLSPLPAIIRSTNARVHKNEKLE